MLQQPFKTYNGGKSGNGTYQQIINFIPKCSTFIDAMVGNGGIVSNLHLPSLTVINDIDAALIEKYNCTGHGRIIKEKIDVHDLIEKYDYKTGSTVFYFDPPYLMSTRKNQQQLYKFEWTMLDHEEFLSRALTVKSNCMISHYPCEMYDKILHSWNKHQFQSTTRQGVATECIYMNYPTPTELQDYRYIGNNFTRRQQIKRQEQRIIEKFEAMAPIVRNNILKALKEKFNF